MEIEILGPLWRGYSVGFDFDGNLQAAHTLRPALQELLSSVRSILGLKLRQLLSDTDPETSGPASQLVSDLSRGSLKALGLLEPKK